MIYHCLVCRRESTTWVNHCLTCGRYNSYSVDGGGIVIKSTSPDVPNVTRVATGLQVFDEVMLGGLVFPSSILIGGIAGAGKSTMILQVAGGLARLGKRVAYVCAEEDVSAVIERARRVGAAHENLDLIRTTDPDVALTVGGGYEVAVYDSIQKLRVTADQITVPKTRILVSQLNKLGSITGETINEHEPDTLLYCHFDSEVDLRDLECTKNRHGALKKAPYTLGEFGVVGMPCKACDQCVVPCKCPPKKKKRKSEELPS